MCPSLNTKSCFVKLGRKKTLGCRYLLCLSLFVSIVELGRKKYKSIDRKKLDVSSNDRLNTISSCTPVRVGGNPENGWYGSWWLCEEELNRMGQTLISFGSGCDSTFEWDFLSVSPSSLCHILDPTITVDRFWMCSNSSKTIVAGRKTINSGASPQFWPLGLSDEPKLAKFSKSNNPKIGSMTELEPKGYSLTSFHGILFDLKLTYALLKIGSQPILKMDIEGSEFDVILSWCDKGMPFLKPTQVLIEFHQRFFSDGTHKFDQALECLRLLGYQKAFDNKGEEFLFFLN